MNELTRNEKCESVVSGGPSQGNHSSLYYLAYLLELIVQLFTSLPTIR